MAPPLEVEVSARGDRAPRRDGVTGEVAVVGERAAREVGRTGAGVVKLDKRGVSRARVRQHLADDQVFQGGRGHRIDRAGRAAGFPARGPGLGSGLAERRCPQHQRMPRPVSRRRPGGLIFVIGLQHDAARRLTQPDGSGLVRKLARPGADHRRADTGVPQRVRVGGDQQKPAPGQPRARREIEIRIAAQFPTGEVDADRTRVIQLDELEVHRLVARRMVVDLREHHTRPSRTRTGEHRALGGGEVRPDQGESQ